MAAMRSAAVDALGALSPQGHIVAFLPDDDVAARYRLQGHRPALAFEHIQPALTLDTVGTRQCQ
jgi:hypothetical protein